MTFDPRSTIRRSASAMLAVVITGALVAGGVAADDAGVAPQIEERPDETELVGDPEAAGPMAGALSEYEQVMSHLYSDHLREIARDWGLEGTPSTSSVDPSLLYSDHLREILSD